MVAKGTAGVAAYAVGPRADSGSSAGKKIALGGRLLHHSTFGLIIPKKINEKIMPLSNPPTAQARIPNFHTFCSARHTFFWTKNLRICLFRCKNDTVEVVRGKKERKTKPRMRKMRK